MRKSKLDVPHIKKQVIKRLATGEPQASIAKSIGLHQPQISRFANRGDIKPFIEQEQMRLADAVPDAVDNVMDLVREMKDIPKKDVRRRELSYKASHDTLKAFGIMPTPVQSQITTNMFSQKNLISPAISGLLEEHSKKFLFSEEELKQIDEANKKPDGEE
jgi:hypothetical protein